MFSETSQIMFQIIVYTRRISDWMGQDDYNEWYVDNIKIESSLDGSWTNGK